MSYVAKNLSHAANNSRTDKIDLEIDYANLEPVLRRRSLRTPPGRTHLRDERPPSTLMNLTERCNEQQVGWKKGKTWVIDVKK